MEIGLALGSNIGDRLNNLKQARDKIGRMKDVVIVAQSSVYETEPVDIAPEFMGISFFNAVLITECRIDLVTLAGLCSEIERQAGRPQDRRRNEPRVIDIDIIYAGQSVVNNDNLTIPHPRWKLRRFVVQPLADVRPDLIIPDETQPVSDILKLLPETPRAFITAAEW